MLNNNLRMITVTLLKNRPKDKTLPTISKDTSLSIPWLKSLLLRGYHSDSHSDKIVTLYEYLSGKKIFEVK